MPRGRRHAPRTNPGRSPSARPHSMEAGGGAAAAHFLASENRAAPRNRKRSRGAVLFAGQSISPAVAALLQEKRRRDVMEDELQETLLALTADIVAAHVSNNSVGMADLPTLIGKDRKSKRMNSRH